MSDGFDFKNRDGRLCLTLCGKKFDVELDDSTISKCREILSDAKRKLGQMKDGVKNDETSDAGVCSFLQQSMDSLLGTGAVELIFGDRPITLVDITGLTCYVLAKLKNAFTEFEAV